MKEKLTLLLVCGCLCFSMPACSGDTTPSQSPSGSTTPTPEIQATETPSPKDALKQTAIDRLSNYFEADNISSVSVSDTKVEAEILVDASAGGDAPTNWSDTRTLALDCCANLQETLTTEEVGNVVVYLVDDSGNILLTVLNGKTAFDTFGDNNSEGTNPNTITLEEFNEIKAGMEYQEVFDIIGGRGEIISEVGSAVDDEYYTVMFQWDGEGSIGANANVMFQGGKVTSKAQFGLE